MIGGNLMKNKNSYARRGSMIKFYAKELGFSNFNRIKNVYTIYRDLQKRYRDMIKLIDTINIQDNPENCIGYIYYDSKGTYNVNFKSGWYTDRRCEADKNYVIVDYQSSYNNGKYYWNDLYKLHNNLVNYMLSGKRL